MTYLPLVNTREVDMEDIILPSAKISMASGIPMMTLIVLKLMKKKFALKMLMCFFIGGEIGDW